MGIFTPKLDLVSKLKSLKLNYLQKLAVSLLFIGLIAIDVSANKMDAFMAEPILVGCNADNNIDNIDLLHINRNSTNIINSSEGSFNKKAIEFIEFLSFCNNVSDPGEIQASDITVCSNSNDPGIINSLSPATGGSGAMEYMWLYSTVTCDFESFQVIANTNSATYNPGPITQTTWFRRCARRAGCDSWDFGESNCVKIEVDNNCQSCDNVSNPGEIRASDNVICAQFNDPGIINSISPASGGSGAIEYMWLYSTTDCNNENFTVLANSNSATYNPGPITQTTWFRRCARRAGCDAWDFGESNCIKIEFENSCGEPAPTGWTLTCDDNQSVEIIGEGIRCEDSYTINIPNANDVVQVIAEVVYKGGNADPSQLTLTTNNESATVPAEFTSPQNAFYFRTTFGSADRVTINDIPNGCKAQSLILYVFREGGQTTASTGVFVQKWIYRDTHCEVLEIPTAPAIRDVEITVPLSEITTDSRIAIVRAEVVDRPEINDEVIIDNINAGDALHIAKLLLQDVNPLDDEIQICVESPEVNGQSLVYAGGIKANPDCKTCDDSDIALTSEVISNYNGSQISCKDADDGRLQAVISGGVPPFEYNWSNGASGQIISNIAPGTYEVTVTDRFGCTATASSVSIDEPSAVVANIQFNTDFAGSPISCNGANDAEIEIVASGGVAPYVYQWGASGNFSNAKTLSNLAPGTYDVQVSDANGCLQFAEITIVEPDEFTGGEIEIRSDYNGSPISCADADDGILRVTATGGTAPYNYSWSNGETTRTIDNLGPGTYQVTVTDQNDCTFVRTVSIDEPAPLTLDLNITTDYNGFNISCIGENDGAISSVASGGLGTLSYAWSNGSSATSINAIEAGTYSLTVSDINGCSIEKSVTLTEPTELIISADVISDYSGSDISCAGENDARAEVMISGSVAPYQINWSNGENTQIISNLAPGQYSVTVTDANGCEQLAQIEVVEPQALECSASITSNYFEGVAISSQGGSDGSAEVTVSGGTGNITYNWSNTASTAQISNLIANTYTVIVADENGCNCEASVTLLDPAKVGNKIFIDLNGNGIQDAGEPGPNNVTVTLTGTSDNGVDVTRTFTTGPDGMYLFDGLLPGDYKITLDVPADFNLTALNVGGDDELDSDFDPTTNMTTVFELNPGDVKLDVDGGIVKYASVGDYVWIDINKDGIQDANEIAIEGVEVTLIGTNGLGQPITLTTSTDVNGKYEFTNLLPGSYKLTFAYPTDIQGLAFTDKNQGAFPTLDSDVNPLTGMTDVFELKSGDDLDAFDAGFIDNTKPILIGIPVDVDVSCTSVPGVPELFVDITASDNLDDNVTIEFTETSTQGTGDACSNYDYVITRTWTATDESGNQAVAIQIITVSDSSAPELTGVPADITIDCAEVPAPAQPAATDDCDDDLTIDFIEERVDGNCDFNYTLKRTWTVVDDCGNSTSLTQEIVVQDNSDPILAGVPADVSVSCNDVPDVSVVTATDNCSFIEEADILFEEEIVPGSCVNSYTILRTWTATDDCGNLTSATQTITVEDREAPVLIGVPADLSMSCDSYVDYQTPVVTATDDCSDNLVVDFMEETISQPCANSFELKRTWTVVDECGKSATETQTIVVTDDEAPMLSGVPANLTLSCEDYATYSNPTVTVTDNCSVGLQVDLLEEIVSQACENTFEIKLTWTATDECGNSTSETQLITVEDNEDPVLSGIPGDLTLSCDEYANYVQPTVTVSDNCTDDIQIDFLEEVVSQGCANTFELKLTWTATDACGNSTSETQTIVVSDEEDPILSGVPPDVTLSCEDYNGYDASVVTVSDNCTDDIQIEFTEEFVTLSCPNTFELKLTWTATDECGNSTTEFQLITVSDDQDPILSGVPADLIVSCEDYNGYDASVVTVTDNCTDDIQIDFLEEVVSQDCPNTFSLKLTWTATDECGNSTSESQFITVTDNQDPVLAGVPADLVVSCEDYNGYDASVVTVTDNCTDDIQIDFLEEVISQDCPNTFELKLTWTATDECGNSTTETQSIIVTDNQDPILAGVPADLVVSCEDYNGYDASVVTVSDNCTDNIQIDFLEEVISQDCPNTFELKLTWTATDECGNSTTETQSIIVTDEQDPVLTGVPADLVVSCEDYNGYDASVVTVSDNCTDNIQIDFLEEVISQDCPNTFELKLTWTATDECGNSTTETQSITVTDDQDPVLTGVPADLTVSCENYNGYDANVVSASDNCTDDLQIDFTEELLEETCANAFKLKLTWSVVDECGNSTTEVQYITVEDNSAPEIEGVPGDVNVDCNAVPAAPVVGSDITATDNCTSPVTIDFLETFEEGSCPNEYVLTRTWTATDECGNSTVETQKVNVFDEIKPELFGVPADANVSCGDLPVAEPIVTATDNCTQDLVVDFEEAIVQGDCEFSYTIYRVWRVTDECGNLTEAQQVIEVSDDLSPSLESAPADVTVSCNSIPSAATLIATDDCGGSFEAEFQEIFAAGKCDNSYTLTRIWTATDACGNQTSETQVVSVEDNEDPELIGVPNNETLTCQDADNLTAPTVTATDNCDDVTVEFEEVKVEGNCPNTFVLTRTWTATDACGNQTQGTQVISVIDIDAPVLSPLEDDLTVNLGNGEQIPTAPTVTAFDECTGSVMVDFSETEEPAGNCGYQIIRTWGARDNCGNVVTHTQIITVLDQLNASLTPTSASICAGESVEFNIDVQGSGFDFDWSSTGGNISPANETALFTADQEGTYTISVQLDDNAGCSATLQAEVTVVNPANVEANSNSPICGGNTIELTATGGSTYSWTGPNGFALNEANPSINNASVDAAGTYTVVVSNGACSVEKTIEVVVGPELVVDYTVFPAECGEFGSINVGFIGGTGNVTFDWSDLSGNDNPSFRDDLIPGTYDVVVTDELGCSEELTGLEVLDACNCDAFAGTLDQSDDKYCLDGGEATITAQPNGDAIIPAGYEAIYVLTEGTDLVIVQAGATPEFTVTDLSNYTIHTLIYDANSLDLSIIEFGVTTGADVLGLLTQGSGTICANLDVNGASFEGVSTFAEVSYTKEEYCGESNGTAKLSPSSYSYSWSDGGNGAERDDLSAGTYQVVATSPQGCSVQFQVEIGSECACVEPVIEDVVIFEAHCGELDASAEVIPAGNASDYTYTWSTNQGTPNGIGNKRSNLAVGFYTVTVTSDDCETVVDVTIGTVGGPTFDNIDITAANCGQNDGAVSLFPTSNTYIWEGGNFTGSSRSDLAPGSYEVIVSDGNVPACLDVLVVVVPEESSITLSSTTIAAPTCNEANGTVEINVDNGSGNYEFLWNDQTQTTDGTRNGLSSGMYEIEVTDLATGCSTTYSLILNDDAASADIEIVNIENESCAGFDNGSVSFNYTLATDFNGPAAISLVSSNGSPALQNSLAPGEYFIYVEDANGCLAGSQSFEIESAIELNLNVGVQDQTCDEDGSIAIEVTGGTPGYTYDWADVSGNDNTADRSGLNPGLYSLEVTDEKGCVIAVQDIEVSNTCTDCGTPDSDALTILTNSSDQYCFDLESCFDPAQVTYTLGNESTAGSSDYGNWELDANGCLVYNSLDLIGDNVDDVCIIATDGTISDTTCVSFSVINIALGGPVTDTVYITTPMDVTLDSCLNIDELGGVVTGSNTNANVDDGIFFISNANCYRYIPNPGVSGAFLDTAIVVLCNNNLQLCDTTVVVLSIGNTANCDDFYTGPTSFVIDDCAQGAPLCLDFEIGDLFDYSITDNGAAYDGVFEVCVLDTQYQYVAFQLGAPGAYTLNEWTANGQTFTLDLFTSPEQLADSMNVWDPAGDWEVFGFVIVGGNGTGDYGSLQISNSTGANFEVPNQIIPDATVIYMSEGTHNLTVENLTDGCFQNIFVDVTCTNPPIIVDTLLTINEGAVDTFCFDFNNVATVVNLCQDQEDGNTTINLVAGTNCISITGAQLGTDEYCFEVCDINGACETINIGIQVVPVTDTIVLVTSLGITDSICLDTTIFQNALDVFINDCESPNNLSVDFNLNQNTYCVEYTADLIGQDTACLVICDSLGFCDTTVLIVQVVVPTPDTLEIPVLVGTTDTICLDGSELTGPIQSIINICPATVGENVDFIVDPTTNCIIYTGTIVGQDTACMVICDAQGVCDTTYIYFDVFTNLLPVAIDDDTTTTIGNPVIIDVLLNDTINGNLEGIEIVGQPTNGTVVINPDGTITYIPNDGFCGGTDQFMYSIENEFGIDMAIVTIEVLCEELIIFNGFSPNGDGVNDIFTILGIENFPNNQVCIFNRWGNQVHAEKGYSNDRGWEGTFDGRRLPDGTYFYVIDDGEGETYSGYLQIQR